MNALVASGLGRSNAVALIRLRAATLILLCSAATTAFAFDEDTASSIVAQSSGMTTGERTRPQLEVSASSLPRFDNIDGSNRTTRIDIRLIAATLFLAPHPWQVPPRPRRVPSRAA